MLRELKIHNLALIEELHVVFDRGLVVLTGETGAGKSIFLQAIHLLAGGRAGSSWVRSGADESVVEALFECPAASRVPDILAGAGIDADPDGAVIIRRVLAVAGRSRFYINGALAAAKLAAEVTAELVSVASQHDHQKLLDPAEHLLFLDAIGDHGAERQGFAELYQNWQRLQGEYRKLQERERDRDRRREFLAFQCREIDEARLVVGEDEELDRTKNLLKSTDELARLGVNAYKQLETVGHDALDSARRDLARMADLDPALASLADDVASICFLLEDHVGSLRSYLDELPTDPAMLDQVTARIHLVKQMKRKYGFTLEEVLAFRASVGQELDELENLTDRLELLARDSQRLERQVMASALELSGKRRRTAERLAALVTDELVSLAFGEARFRVSFRAPELLTAADCGPTGLDNPEFLFSANPGEPEKPVAQVASGGELSRLMLALKSILARKDQVETVIFDEIDAGISGSAAAKVGEKIRQLANHHQVLCITHLPQIAARADQHFLVTKETMAGRTRTRLGQLDEQSRPGAIAAMLDGSTVTARTMAYVEDLLARSRSLVSEN